MEQFRDRMHRTPGKIAMKRVLPFVIIALLAAFCGLTRPCLAGNAGKGKVVIHYFWGVGCPHCAEAKPFLEDLKGRYPGVEVREVEVMEHRENIPALMEMARRHGVEATGVPMFFVGNRVIAGFSAEKGMELEALVREELAGRVAPADDRRGIAVELPLLGRVESGAFSLPLFTVIIAAVDSFNPCAFFVLFFLLSLMLHAGSRSRMLLVGGTFVLCSGVVYFFLMAAWLNVFLLFGQIPAVTVGAGVVAVVIALINIKEYFFFRQGVSLTIPEHAKPGLYARMRRIISAGALPAMLAGTVVLALVANSYELLCTAGFPMVYTRALTLNPLTPLQHYLYLALYNGVYILPLAAIVILFALTMGSRKLSEREGKVLKLVSGMMMLGLGSILLAAPGLLNSAIVSIAVLASALAGTGLIVLLRPPGEDHP